MLFGFVGAAATGFLLTAIPNWTGRLPIAGKPLASLFGLWLCGRLAVLFSGVIGVAVAALVDTAFFIVVAAVCAREVIGSKKRNLPIVFMLLLFGIADAADHAQAAGIIGDKALAADVAIALVVLMISVIGGRIIPSFTRNWMVKRHLGGPLPTQPQQFDILVIVGTALALAAWIIGPGNVAAGKMLMIAALLQLLRLARWRGYRTSTDLLVLILHIGYLWVPVGLFLLGLSALHLFPQSGALHALTAGAMGTMILAIMTRAILGHAGRELRADRPTAGIYLLVTTGAILRVAAPLGYADYSPMIILSGAAWGAALLLFMMSYGPMLWRPTLGSA